MIKMPEKKADSDAAEDAVLQHEPSFNKRRLLESKKYASKRDIISALLDEEKQYTIAEVEYLIDRYKKGKVK